MKKITIICLTVLMIVCGSAYADMNVDIYSGYKSQVGVDKDKYNIGLNYAFIKVQYLPFFMKINDKEIVFGPYVNINKDWGEYTNINGVTNDWDNMGYQFGLSLKHYTKFWDTTLNIGYEDSRRDGDVNEQNDDVLCFEYDLTYYKNRVIKKNWWTRVNIFAYYKYVLNSDVKKGNEYKADRGEIRTTPYLYDWRLNNRKIRLSYGLEAFAGYERSAGKYYIGGSPLVFAMAYKGENDPYHKEILRVTLLSYKYQIDGYKDTYSPISLLFQWDF